MPRLLPLLLLLTVVEHAHGLETNCRNGVDDDGDSKIDSMDPDCITVIYVREDCSPWEPQPPDPPLPAELRKCYYFDENQEMLDWVWNTRQPSEQRPLAVDIGPGTIVSPANSELGCADGQRPPLWCPLGSGHVTFRGAGRESTLILNPSPPINGSPSGAAVYANACEDLEFRDLAIESWNTGVWWDGAYGSSTWTDVRITGQFYGWYDIRGSGLSIGGSPVPAEPVGTTRSSHYFYSCKIERSVFSPINATPFTAWLSSVSDAWLYGSEILANGEPGEGKVTAVQLWGGRGTVCGQDQVRSGPRFRMFGGAIRAAGDDVTGVLVLGDPGLSSADRPEFHLHGGIISLASGTGGPLVGLLIGDSNPTGPQAFAHTIDTAFALATAGSATRVLSGVSLGGNGSAVSPLAWGPRTDPPPVVSESGQDSYMEIDCDAACCTDTGGNSVHEMVYDSTCLLPGGPWRDQVTGACRDLNCPP